MSAFFSGSETALTASSRAKLKAQADKGSLRRARRDDGDGGQRADDRRAASGQQHRQHPVGGAGDGALDAALGDSGVALATG
jgi:hypothetical protein